MLVKCYIWPGKDRDGKFDDSFELYGQRFISILRYDKIDSKRFTVTGVRFVSADRMMIQKELAYEIPYGVKVGGGSRVHYKAEVDAQIVGEDALNHKAESEKQREMICTRKTLLVNGKIFLN